MASPGTPEPSPALQPLLRRLEYWRKFNESDRQAVLSLSHSVRTFEPHHYIVREFDRATFTCALLSGFAIRHKIVGSGHRQIVAVHLKGEFVDLQNSLLGLADHSVQMLTRGTVAIIARDEVERIAFQHPTVGRALWTDSLVDGSIFREWIANIGRRDARTRVAHVLCEFALRMKVAGLGERTGYEMPLTQEQLADVTGLTPVHINRTLKQLQAEGLIERTHPRSIMIGDWRKLADSGDFNSGYLHLKEAEPALD